MPQNRLLGSWTITEARQACERVRRELAEMKAATRDSIATSREMMAEVDAAVVAVGARVRQRLPTDI
jgi:hypothetical protein